MVRRQAQPENCAVVRDFSAISAGRTRNDHKRPTTMRWGEELGMRGHVVLESGLPRYDGSIIEARRAPSECRPARVGPSAKLVSPSAACRREGYVGNFVTAAILLGRDPPGASANLTFLHNNAGSGRAASMDIFRRPAPGLKSDANIGFHISFGNMRIQGWRPSPFVNSSDGAPSPP